MKTINQIGNVTYANTKGGNDMTKVNGTVRAHCLHCNAVLVKKNVKYCDRKCYNASRKVGAKIAPSKTPVKASVNSGVANNTIAFEKALKNMKRFESALTLHRLKKLVDIAGERALVIRVDAGIVINWIVGDKFYLVYYRPGRVITHKICDFEAMKASINRCMQRTTFKDSMKIIEYIKLAEQMKGGE